RARAAIDISDGLLADLGHVLDASGVGATLRVDRLPRSPAFTRWAGDQAQQWRLQLTGGDDYELCVCLPPEQVEPMTAELGVALTPIGTIDARPGLRLRDANGRVAPPGRAGYNHFAPDGHVTGDGACG